MKTQIEISQSVALLEEENILIIHKKGKVVTVKLEPQLTSILLRLVLSKNTLVTKESFINAIWGDNVFVGQTALRKNIYKLRNLIKNNNLSNELNIVTISKKGYKLLINNPKFNAPINSKKTIFRITYLSVAALMLLFFSIQFSSEEEEETIIKMVDSEFITDSSILNEE